MKRLISLAAFAVFATACQQANQEQNQAVEKKQDNSVAFAEMTQAEKDSYAVGSGEGKRVLDRINSLNDMEYTAFDKEAYARGYTDMLMGKNTVSDEELQAQATAFGERLRTHEQTFRAKQAEDNKAKQVTFLTENAKKEGVKTTESGLQYKEIAPGDGKNFPKATDTVKVHYTGTLIDGKKFDSSVDRGQPAQFPLNGVIKGWTEGIPLMSKGAKYEFYIPSELAYGPQGRPSIPGNSLLIFEVELLDIVEPPKPADLSKKEEPVKQ